MTLGRLTALEVDKIRQEHADIVERIAELRAILGDEARVMAIVREELQEISDAYGDERRTQISFAEGEIDIEDLIADQQMVITITNSGYIKSLPLATYRQQRRGGVGVTGMDMKDGDYIEHLFVTSTHDFLLFFTNRGKVYRLKVYELPEAQRTAKGRALVNLLPLREGERVQSVLSTRDFSEAPYLLFATRNGTVKKTELLRYNTPIRADGIIAISIRDDDELVAVRRVDEGDEVIIVSRAGLTVRFSEEDARAMGRDTSGVRGMNVGRGEVIAMDIARDDQDLLVVTENGYGKRTRIDQYRKTSRGAMGVRTIKLTEAKGGLAGALVVREHQELVFISQSGMVQRTGVRGISQQGRSATGVRVMNVREDDCVRAIALVVESEPDDGADELPLERRRPRARGQRRLAPARGARRGDERLPRALVRGRRGGRRGDGDERSLRRLFLAVVRVRYIGITRERRWSELCLTVLAGPWRCPATRSEGWPRLAESTPRHRLDQCREWSLRHRRFERRPSGRGLCPAKSFAKGAFVEGALRFVSLPWQAPRRLWQARACAAAIEAFRARSQLRLRAATQRRAPCSVVSCDASSCQWTAAWGSSVLWCPPREFALRGLWFRASQRKLGAGGLPRQQRARPDSPLGREVGAPGGGDAGAGDLDEDVGARACAGCAWGSFRPGGGGRRPCGGCRGRRRRRCSPSWSRRPSSAGSRGRRSAGRASRSTGRSSCRARRPRGG